MVKKEKFRYTVIIAIGMVAFLCGCRPSYRIISMDAHYLPVNEADLPDPAATKLVEKYKSRLDEQMNEVIGEAAIDMFPGKPESILTNFTSDVMLTIDKKHTEGDAVDLTLMNVAGHRAPIAKGIITTGDMYSTYSFENELIVLRIKGTDLKAVFDAYAAMGGAGISSTVQLRIKDKKITQALIHNKPVEDEKIYLVVTLDYLAEGNNGMQALTKAVSAIPTGITLRDHMMEYIRRMHAEGKKIEAVTDHRIVIEY